MGPVAGPDTRPRGHPRADRGDGLVFVGLGLFGYFIRRAAKKEQEREREDGES